MFKRISPQMMSTIDVENHDKIDMENHNTIDAENIKNSNNDDRNCKECRICLQQTYPLIIACKCSGTVKYVHEECLMHWAQQLVKKSLKQQQQDGDYQLLTSIQCELCKEPIQLKIQWKDVNLSLNEAKHRNQDYFWPIIIVNIIIGLICTTCVSFSLAILIMVLTENPRVDYQRFKNDPYVTWTILSCSFLVGLIFLFKSIREIYFVFIRKEFKIDGVVYKQILNNQKDEEQIQEHVSPIKSISDVKKMLQYQKQKLNQYYPQENPLSFENPPSQQQKSNANLIIPKNLPQSLKDKVFQLQSKVIQPLNNATFQKQSRNIPF